MKSFISALVLLTCTSSAFAWEKIADCDSGAFVIDRQASRTSYDYEYQVVFRDDVVQFLLDKKAIVESDLNAAGEIVSNLGTSKNVVNYGRVTDDVAFMFQDNNAGNAFVLGFNSMSRWPTYYGDYTFRDCWFKYGPIGRQ
jgi:hypothetical protein